MISFGSIRDAQLRQFERDMRDHGPRYGEATVHGDTYRVRSLLPGKELGEFAARLSVARIARPSRKIRRKLGIKGEMMPLQVWVALRCTVDADGNRLFMDEDADALAEDGLLVARLSDCALNLTGIHRADKRTVDLDLGAFKGASS